jgi:hypothetical protein
MNQPFIAVEAHGFHGQATGLGNLPDPQSLRLHATTPLIQESAATLRSATR